MMVYLRLWRTTAKLADDKEISYTKGHTEICFLIRESILSRFYGVPTNSGILEQWNLQLSYINSV